MKIMSDDEQLLAVWRKRVKHRQGHPHRGDEVRMEGVRDEADLVAITMLGAAARAAKNASDLRVQMDKLRSALTEIRQACNHRESDRGAPDTLRQIFRTAENALATPVKRRR